MCYNPHKEAELWHRQKPKKRRNTATRLSRKTAWSVGGSSRRSGIVGVFALRASRYATSERTRRLLRYVPIADRRSGQLTATRVSSVRWSAREGHRRAGLQASGAGSTRILGGPRFVSVRAVGVSSGELRTPSANVNIIVRTPAICGAVGCRSSRRKLWTD
jgi:hypothetical protein